MTPGHPPYALSSLIHMFGNFEVSHSVQLLRCYSSDPLLASAGPLRALQRPEADLEGQKKRPGIPGRCDDRYHHSRRYSAPSTHESLKPGLASPYLSLGQCIITRPICQMPPLPSDGDEGIRTPDLLRAREALSQLSYIPVQVWAILDLNQRPFPYQRNALAD